LKISKPIVPGQRVYNKEGRLGHVIAFDEESVKFEVKFQSVGGNEFLRYDELQTVEEFIEKIQKKKSLIGGLNEESKHMEEEDHEDESRYEKLGHMLGKHHNVSHNKKNLNLSQPRTASKSPQRVGQGLKSILNSKDQQKQMAQALGLPTVSLSEQHAQVSIHKRKIIAGLGISMNSTPPTRNQSHDHILDASSSHQSIENNHHDYNHNHSSSSSSAANNSPPRMKVLARVLKKNGTPPPRRRSLSKTSTPKRDKHPLHQRGQRSKSPLNASQRPKPVNSRSQSRPKSLERVNTFEALPQPKAGISRSNSYHTIEAQQHSLVPPVGDVKEKENMHKKELKRPSSVPKMPSLFASLGRAQSKINTTKASQELELSKAEMNQPKLPRPDSSNQINSRGASRNSQGSSERGTSQPKLPRPDSSNQINSRGASRNSQGSSERGTSQPKLPRPDSSNQINSRGASRNSQGSSERGTSQRTLTPRQSQELEHLQDQLGFKLLSQSRTHKHEQKRTSHFSGPFLQTMYSGESMKIEQLENSKLTPTFRDFNRALGTAL